MILNLIHNKIPNIGKNKDFSRFIILTYPRTGSNYLIFKLQFTNKVICYNELFYSKNKIVTSYPDLIFKSWVLKYRNHFSNSFLNEIFQSYDDKIKAVGFKLTYSQNEIFNNKNLIKTLAEKFKVSFIHLKRRNLLECYVSTKLMEKNNIVYAINPKYLNDFKKNTNHFILSSEYYSPLITIDITDLNKYINKIKNDEARYNLIINSFPNIDVFYEDLIAHTDFEINRIGQLLRIPSLAVDNKEEFPIEKLNNKPLREIISNYNEVEDFLYKNNLEGYLNKNSEND
jgi:predicted transcriptional regulator YdeE